MAKRKSQAVAFDDVTLAWLWHNVPARLWWTLLTLIAAAFAFGVVLGSKPVVQDIFGLQPRSATAASEGPAEAVFLPGDLVFVLADSFKRPRTTTVNVKVMAARGSIALPREAALVKFDLHSEILSDFTKNKQQLFSPIADLRFATYNEAILFDSLYDTLTRLEKIDGKKAIFLVATRFDTISRHTYGEILKKAQASDTMIYAVSVGQLYRLYTENQRSSFDNIDFVAADNHLRSLSAATGGQAFYPRFMNEYSDIYDNISKQLRTQYSLSFTPGNLKKDGKLHKLRVEVPDLDLNKDGKKDGVKARHKQGYYAPKS